jgi:hypothetical protein
MLCISSRTEPIPDSKNVALLVTLSPTATRPKGGMRTVPDPALWFDNTAVACRILPQDTRNAVLQGASEDGKTSMLSRHDGINVIDN